VPSAKRRILGGALLFAGFLAFSWTFFGWIPGRTATLAADYLRLVPPWRAAGAPIQNPTLTDPLWQFYPWQLEFRRAIFAGRFPLWDPSIYAGAPIAANPQSAFFFPLTWLVVPFGVPTGMSIAATLRPALAAVFAFLFFRKIGYRLLGAAFGSLTFGFSLPFVVWAEHPHDNAFLIFPLLLLAIERVLRDPTPRSVALLGLVGTLLVLSGHPESAFFCATIGMAYAITLWRSEGARSSRNRLAVGLLAAAAAAVFISLFALVPYSLAILQSTAWRTHEHVAKALPIRAVPLLFFPDFYGNPSRGQLLSGLIMGFSEAAFFPGLLALSLVGLGLRRPTTRIAFWIWAIFVAAFLVFFAPGVPGFTDIPILGRTFPARVAVLACFGVGAISGRALDEIDRSRFGSSFRFAVVSVALISAVVAFVFHTTASRAPSFLWGAALLTLAVLFGSLGAARPVLAATAICVLQAVDLWHASADFHPRVPIASIYPEFAEVPRLRKEMGSGRLLAVGATFPPNAATVYGLRDVRGYDAIETTSYRSAREHLATWSSDPRLPAMTAIDLTMESANRFSLLAVQALVFPPGIEVSEPAQRRLGMRFGPSIRGQSIWLQPLENPTRRAQSISTALPGRVENLSAEKSLDLRSVSRVEGISAPIEFPRSPPPSLDFERDDPEDILISSRSSVPFLLRLSDAFDPGWRALLDGKPVRIYRCDGAFRGVFVSPGKHRVEMQYHFPGMPLTGIVSALAAAATVLLSCRSR
jgi:hypothetical protein